jgi:hypothetical protein
MLAEAAEEGGLVIGGHRVGRPGALGGLGGLDAARRRILEPRDHRLVGVARADRLLGAVGDAARERPGLDSAMDGDKLGEAVGHLLHLPQMPLQRLLVQRVLEIGGERLGLGVVFLLDGREHVARRLQIGRRQLGLGARAEGQRGDESGRDRKKPHAGSP